MSVLFEICQKKQTYVDACKDKRSLDDIKASLKDASPVRDFINAIVAQNENGASGFICEIKKASPSKGIIRDDFNPANHAQDYAAGGATCLSVLTDAPYFQGHDDYLIQARNACTLPALRKDFTVDAYQIYESRALGADCILLIMAALEPSKARDFYDIATDLGMDVLVEIHDEPELEQALTFSPKMIGVNARNLKTLEVSLQTTRDLLPQIPDDCIKIAESGIATHEDTVNLRGFGANGFLIGESLMRQDDITAALTTLKGEK